MRQHPPATPIRPLPQRPLALAGPRAHTAGFTLIEILAAVMILTITAGALVSTIITSGRLNRVSSEVATAREAIESVIEQIKSTTFTDVFATYNADPADDPGGAGTAPGANFAAGNLRPAADDPDGFVGEVVFPTIGGALREDVEDPRISMPRDLNLSGAIDTDDHATDYVLLPFVVQVTWRGPAGVRTVTQSYNLGDLR